jgi:dipeptidyl aminopeptidase/acylaminoacyl peptidase
MTTFDRFERAIPGLMTELAPARVPDYLDDMLRQTARTRQRPAWSTLERWLPMGTLARPLPMRPFPWRTIGVLLMLAALIAGATLLYVGSRDRVPPPFGPARNGAIVFSTADGDIVRADPATGAVTTLIDDATEFDSAPWFSNDGTKFAFDRQVASGSVLRSLVVASADGSGVRELSGPESEIRWFEWSPSGDRMLVLRQSDRFGEVTLVDAADGALTTFDVGLDVRAASFRPGTDQLVFSTASAFYVVGTDGTGLRRIVLDTASLDQYAISPDGTLLAYATWVGGVAEGRIHVIEIDTGVELPIDFDPGFEYTDLLPTFTPDGKALIVERHDQMGYKPTILPLDGGPPVPMGPYHPSSTNGAGVTLSPDGTKAIATYRVDGTTWLLDTATGDGERLDWPIPGEQTATWQRLAP